MPEEKVFEVCIEVWREDGDSIVIRKIPRPIEDLEYHEYTALITYLLKTLYNLIEMGEDLFPPDIRIRGDD